jgi:phosphoenolpyruvate-protein kinase (PTS system EI component)
MGSGFRGRTSHAALMAKQHGVHAIFGLSFQIDLKIDG